MHQLEQLIDEAVGAFRERLVAAAGTMFAAMDPMAFCAAERGLFSLARELAAEITQEVVQRVCDDPDRRVRAMQNLGERAAERGIELRVQRVRETTFRTLSGRTISVKAQYAATKPLGGGPRLETRGAQGTGVYPVLDQLGVADHSTPALRLQISHAVCEANSVASARDLLAIGGVEVDHKAALRLTYAVADVALESRRRAMAEMPVRTGDWAGRRVVATVDGGRVLVRRRVAGRPRRGGRKRFVAEWREPKVVTIYVIGEDGKRDRSVAPVIDGTLEDADAVFDLLAYHLLRLGAKEAAEVTLVGDGAPWIWNRAEWLREQLGLPADRFHEIVDYFHAVERIGDVVKAQGRWSDDQRLSWMTEVKRRLKAGRIEGVELALAELRYPSKEAKETEMAYWSRNRDRLRYGDFQQRGLPIGSGAVESSVRRVVNLRMKGASIAWTAAHAEGVLHLRAHAKSGRWPELERTVLEHPGWRPTARVTRPAA
jgi:hypothetical protein